VRPDGYRIRRARAGELPALADIERAAARLLVGYAPEAVLSETTPLADLQLARSLGHLWVAVSHDRPVGFAHVKRLEPETAHLDELDVHPDHGRRGLGRRLVIAVCEAATRAGLRAVTLSTFRDPPWNMPFYLSLDFVVISRSDLSEALMTIAADEVRRGLDPDKRVMMRCDIGRER